MSGMFDPDKGMAIVTEVLAVSNPQTQLVESDVASTQANRNGDRGSGKGKVGRPKWQAGGGTTSPLHK